MRLWSLHPKYLDSKGLVALWRETLLAKHVLNGKTRGYKHHPQLNRFKGIKIDSIDYYLSVIYNESLKRGYNFNKEKINWNFDKIKINVTQGQVEYEANHLLNKLKVREPKRHISLAKNIIFDVHPIFNVITGDIEDWEIIK